MTLGKLKNYILRGHEPIEVSIEKWAVWFGNTDRTVKNTKVGDIVISTVFLGLDHNFNRSGPPLLFETMTFGDDEERCRRYATWDEAVEGHKEIVSIVQNIVETRMNRRQTRTVKMR